MILSRRYLYTVIFHKRVLNQDKIFKDGVNSWSWKVFIEYNDVTDAVTKSRKSK